MGAGLAGLAAAARAAELGLRVLVLEQGDVERYPCNSRYSGGILHLAFRNIKDDPASLAKAIAEATHGYADTALATLLAHNSARAADWLQAQGARFIRAGQVVWQQWVMAPPRPVSPGLDWNGRGPDVTLRALAERLRGRGGELLLNARVTALIEQGGTVGGVQARVGGDTRDFPAAAVLIADGGFQANLELLGAHIAPQPAKVLQRGAGNARGEGMQLATALGAATSDLTAFYGHLLCQQAFENPMLWPYPQLDELATAGIVVDRGGRRVVDEGRGGVHIANQIAHRPDPLDCLVVFDSQIWDVNGTQHRIPANPHLVRAGARMLKADSIAELAAQAGVDAGALADTVAGYNAAVAAGATAAMQPTRSAGQFTPVPLRKAPFYALPLCVGITHTAGGLCIDTQARVVRADGSPIAGLHAAGSAVGGIEGGPEAGYIGGLMKALVLGLVAAEAVAAGRS